VIDWLLDGDPAIRWQVLRDLTNASAADVAVERSRVEHDGWGARLLAQEGPDGLWEGGACFPASYRGGEPGQPWTATMHTLQERPARRRRCAPPVAAVRSTCSRAACSAARAPARSSLGTSRVRVPLLLALRRTTCARLLPPDERRP